MASPVVLFSKVQRRSSTWDGALLLHINNAPPLSRNKERGFDNVQLVSAERQDLYGKLAVNPNVDGWDWPCRLAVGSTATAGLPMYIPLSIVG